MIYVSGPGHGGPAVVATPIDCTYSEIYPNVSQDETGLQKLFLQFSFPDGIPSRTSPKCPGSIHEGGELGYSLRRAFGAVFEHSLPGASPWTRLTNHRKTCFRRARSRSWTLRRHILCCSIRKVLSLPKTTRLHLCHDYLPGGFGGFRTM